MEPCSVAAWEVDWWFNADPTDRFVPTYEPVRYKMYSEVAGTATAGPSPFVAVDPAYLLADILKPDSYSGKRNYAVRDNAGLSDSRFTWVWIDGDPVAKTNIYTKWFTDPALLTAVPKELSSPGTLYLWRHNGSRQLVYQETTILHTSIGWPTEIEITEPGYYALDVCLETSPIPGPLFLMVKAYGNCPTISHLAIDGLEQREQDFEDLRMTGRSLMLSPESVDAAKGGLVAGVQLPTMELPTSLVPYNEDQSIMQKLNNRQGAVRMDFEDGMYAYHRPTSPEELAFQHPFHYTVVGKEGSTSRNLITGYDVPMFPAGGWVVLAVEAAPNAFGGSSPFPGALARVTVAQAMEYHTTSLWYHLGVPPTAMLENEQVAAIVRGLPQFYENPFHFSDITNWVKRNAGALKRAFAAATSAGSILFPEFAAPLMGANAVVQEL